MEKKPIEYQDFVDVCISFGITDELYIKLSYDVYVASVAGSYEDVKRETNKRDTNLYLRSMGRMN